MVRVLGVDSGMDALITEYGAIKNHDFQLHFTYPTQDEMKEMNLLNRELDKKTQQDIEEKMQI